MSSINEALRRARYLSESPASEAGPPYAEEIDYPRPRSRWVWVGLGLAAAVLAGAVWFMYPSPPAESPKAARLAAQPKPIREPAAGLSPKASAPTQAGAQDKVSPGPSAPARPAAPAARPRTSRPAESPGPLPVPARPAASASQPKATEIPPPKLEEARPEPRPKVQLAPLAKVQPKPRPEVRAESRPEPQTAPAPAPAPSPVPVQPKPRPKPLAEAKPELIPKPLTKARDHFLAARAAQKQGRDSQAVYHYRQALLMDPRMGRAYLNLGNIFFHRHNDMGKALEMYKQALKLEPNNKKAHNNLGVLFLRQGLLGQAETEFTAALQQDPKYADALYNMACLAARQGRAGRAMDYLLEAGRVRPEAALWAAGDEDLKSLRRRPEFRKFVKRAGADKPKGK